MSGENIIQTQNTTLFIQAQIRAIQIIYNRYSKEHAHVCQNGVSCKEANYI